MSTKKDMVREALGNLLFALDNMKCDDRPAVYSLSVRAAMNQAKRLINESALSRKRAKASKDGAP